MANPVVTLRAAIVEAAKVLVGDESADATISLEANEGCDVLELGFFNEDGLPFKVALKETLTETLVELAGDLATGLEEAAEQKREEFKDSFDGDLQEIRDLTEVDDISEWEGILNDIIEAAERIKRTRNRSDNELGEAETLEEAAEELRSAIEQFEISQRPVELVS